MSEWTASDLKSANIIYLVKTNVVSGWMNKAGFKYEAYKNSYYVGRHEAPELVEDQKHYLQKNFEDE